MTAVLKSEFAVLIQQAIDADKSVDCPGIAQTYNGVCIKEELDTITKNVTKSWSPLKATVASIVAKLKYPDWDTRNHQTQIGGKFSLRTIDRCYVSDYLFKHGYYDTVTEFALTRSFEKAEPFNKSYTGNISPKVCKTAFLNIVEVINTCGGDELVELLQEMLVYVMRFLKERHDRDQALKNTIVEGSKEVNLLTVWDFLEEMNKLGQEMSGMSVIPVIIVHTVLSTIQPYLWKDVSIKPLKEHTAPDNHSKSYGDVEGMQSDIPIIAIEVKHNIAIIESIVSTFDKKTNQTNIPLKFIITTAKTPRHFTKNNICVDSLTSFVTSHLQQVLVFEPTICEMFLMELQKKVVNYTNVSLPVKEAMHSMIASHLVSASSV